MLMQIEVPRVFRCRFLCTRVTAYDEFFLPHRIAFMEGKVCILGESMKETFEREGIIEVMAEVGIEDPSIKQSEIKWMEGIYQ